VSSTTPNAIALFLVTGIGAFGGEAQPGGVEGLEAPIDQSSQLTDLHSPASRFHAQKYTTLMEIRVTAVDVKIRC
jgi:hypothetical protein